MKNFKKGLITRIHNSRYSNLKKGVKKLQELNKSINIIVIDCDPSKAFGDFKLTSNLTIWDRDRKVPINYH